MKKSRLSSIIVLIVLGISFLNFISAQTEIDYFHGIGCSHCGNVKDSGVLGRVSQIEGVYLRDNEIYYNHESQIRFNKMMEFLDVKPEYRGVPFAVVNCSGKYTYLVGDIEINQKLEEYALNCDFEEVEVKEWPIGDVTSNTHITLLGIIAAALVDSINPCAFGVLIFLMVCLLNLGSSKRALKYGMVYTFFVFLTYFLAGFGLFKVIQSLSAFSKVVYGTIGVIVLTIAFIEFFDYFQTKRNKDSILKIPIKAKPIIEKIIKKGTLPAMIIAGVLVSLFELPCTGGIYLAILTSMAQNNSFSIFYLFLYNLIFVFPLILITYMIYKGNSTKSLQDWIDKNKEWMKLFAGIILLLFAWYILSRIKLF